MKPVLILSMIGIFQRNFLYHLLFVDESENKCSDTNSLDMDQSFVSFSARIPIGRWWYLSEQ